MKTKHKFALLTNDVETTSILNHRLDDNIGGYLGSQGMPRLLDLYDKFGVQATFFFTGHIATLYPELVKMAMTRGHEIGSHGYTHDPNHAFDTLSIKEQIAHLVKSKSILEDICGTQVISFRAPAARVNRNIGVALEEVGFKTDSSVSSQRLDMFFSFGSAKKLNWIFAPRLPYFIDRKNVFKRGDSDILEIPISAMVFPYIGTFMRLSPFLNRMTRNVLYYENRLNGRPFVFLTHPNEFIDENQNGTSIVRRGSNYVSYILGDVVRHKLKVKNLGAKALPLLERELMFFRQKGFNFLTCSKLYEEERGINASQ